MDPLLLVPIAGVLVLNFFLWKRRGRGFRRHVDDFIRVLQPYVNEPVVDALVLQPAGSVGRQARSEQGRGLRTLAGSLGGELDAAVAEHRADQDADEELPPMTALALTERCCHLLPVVLANGVWSAGPIERSWDRTDARYDTSARALTIQLTITLSDWTGHYELARDPAGYAAATLTKLQSGT